MLCFKCGFFDHEQVDCGLEEVKTRHSSGAMVPYYGNWLKEDSKVKHCFEFLMAHSIKKRQWKVEGNNKSPKEPTELQSARAEKVGEIRSCCKGNRSLGEDTRKEELTLTIGEDSVVHGNKKNFVEVVPSHQKRYQVKENQENTGEGKIDFSNLEDLSVLSDDDKAVDLARKGRRSVGLSGGLILMWEGGLKIKILSHSKFHIHTVVCDLKSRLWNFTGIYGDLMKNQRHNFWALLQRLSEEASGPWLIGGDFNECNGQKENFMLQNLDRCLANVEWVNLFPNRKAFYLE
ncbi:hypothetical protein F8388_010561 [Cannabis sativa]|uniref:Uncharacterized protein n=1 Tax=Cannabis sativa TaxID=3483 RepID=A0A7J6GPY0_CANSA|nr:hypothetical protein F8388_010561 [Cannabis sativa]